MLFPLTALFWLLCCSAFANLPRPEAVRQHVGISTASSQQAHRCAAFADSDDHDSLSLLDFTALVDHWGHVLDGFGYAHDPLGLRTNVTRYLGMTTNYVAVGYDNIGQITSWTATEWSGTPRLNEQLAWAYDKSDNLHISHSRVGSQKLRQNESIRRQCGYRWRDRKSARGANRTRDG